MNVKCLPSTSQTLCLFGVFVKRNSWHLSKDDLFAAFSLYFKTNCLRNIIKNHEIGKDISRKTNENQYFFVHGNTINIKNSSLLIWNLKVKVIIWTLPWDFSQIEKFFIFHNKVSLLIFNKCGNQELFRRFSMFWTTLHSIEIAILFFPSFFFHTNLRKQLITKITRIK